LKANTKLFCDYEWLKLSPRSLVFEGNHFVLILEDSEKKAVLPLRFSIESGDLLGVPNLKSLWKKSLTTINEHLFKAWNVELQRCVFVKQVSGRHRVRLYYSKDGEQQFMEQDLDNVLGMSLEAKLPFYASRAYIENSKVGSANNENFIVNQKWTDGRQKYLM
jgi:hypothetical protein